MDDSGIGITEEDGAKFYMTLMWVFVSNNLNRAALVQIVVLSEFAKLKMEKED